MHLHLLVGICCGVGSKGRLWPTALQLDAVCACSVTNVPLLRMGDQQQKATLVLGWLGYTVVIDRIGRPETHCYTRHL
jgi:hypothetical protein